MNAETERKPAAAGRARWIAAGFVGAVAASIVTVIWTGLMVEGRPGEFDAGFRSVTLVVGEVRPIELIFDSPAAHAAAGFALDLPAPLGLAAGEAATRTVELVPGTNVITVTVRAQAAGSGYLEARLTGDEPIALERVFVTVESADQI